MDRDPSEILDFLAEEYPESIVFRDPDYAEAIVGVSTDGNIIYDFYLMVESLMHEDDISEEDAIDFIEFNTLRSIPYADEPRPIVIYGIGGVV